jgi:hypothetical protein
MSISTDSPVTLITGGASGIGAGRGVVRPSGRVR